MIEVDLINDARFNVVLKISDHGFEIICEFRPEFIKWASMLKGRWGYYFPIDLRYYRNYETLDELLMLRALPRKPVTREYLLNSDVLVMEFEEPNDAMLFKMRWS